MPDDVITRTNRNGVEMLKIDLGAGLTRATIALRAPEHSEKRLRNHKEARKAYDTVLDFVQRVTLTSEDTQEISDKLAQLKSSLEKLGDSFR